MKHVQIRPGLFLQQQVVPKQKDPKTKKVMEGTVNHIWIYDRSGSMSGSLRQLCGDLYNRVQSIPKGDTITLGWFSGEGEFNFIVKGFKINDESDFKAISRAIDSNSTTVGCTCFSEILAETETVVKDLSMFSDNFALMMFTDGYPVVSNYSREIDRINSAIDKIKGKVSSSLLVGYGNYYNKELMSKMATQLGGSLVHSANLVEFSIHLNEFVETSSDNLPKVTVDLCAIPTGEVLSLSKKSISIYEIKRGQLQVDFVPTKQKEDSIFFLTNMVDKNSKEVKLTDATFNGNSDHDSIVRGMYAMAYALTQKTKVDEALDILSVIGDVAVVDSVTNAFTNEEYGRAEDMMRQALMPRKRMARGRKVGHVPARDAFCLIDLFDVLIADEKAKFYPTHPSFKYNRIGRKSEQDPSYPKFVRDLECAVPFENLTWNKKMLNLSVLANMSGTVDLGEEAAKVGLSRQFNTVQFRNYALIKDGFANVQELPVTVSPHTRQYLESVGAVKTTDGEVVILDLTKIPTMNRASADGKTSAKLMFQQRIKEIKLASEAKVYKHYLKFMEDGDDTKKTWSEKAEAFLASKGIKSGVYSPPKTEQPPTDFYMAKEFDVKIKGLSTIPSIADVEEKMISKKGMTPAEKLVYNAIHFCKTSGLDSMTERVKKAFLKDQLSSVQGELRTIRKDIQKTKFAIILGKRWFDEFTSREEGSLEVDGYSCSMSLREVKVEL